MHMSTPFSPFKNSKSFSKPNVSKYTPFNLYKLCKDKERFNQDFSNSPIYSTIMNSTCFVHKEGNPFSNETKISYLPVSKSFPSNGKTILALLSQSEIPLDDKWISLPAYAKKDNKMHVQDFQLATTGTKSNKEKDYSDTSERECGEENGINVTDENLVSFTEFTYDTGRDVKHVEAFVYYVSSVEPARPIQPVSKETEDPTQKIMSWVIFDNPYDIVKRKRINVKSSGDCAGELSVVMKVSDLKNLIEFLF